MKYLVITLIIFLFSCGQSQKPKDLIYEGERYKIDINNLPNELSDKEDAKLGYAMGINSSIQLGRDSVAMDLNYFIIGLLHGMNQDTSQFWLTSQEFQQTMQNFEESMYQLQQRQFRESQDRYDSISGFYFENAKKYIEEIPEKYEYTKHERGFWYNKTKEGFGEKLGFDMAGGFEIKGWLPADSTQVISFGNQAEPFYLFLEEAFPSLYEIWDQLKIGDEVDLFAPAELVFGEEGINGRVPRHAPILLQVRVLEQTDKKPMNPNMQQPGGMNGMSPQGGGMPPQNGMRPPQGGRMPPQGGGMPPRR